MYQEVCFNQGTEAGGVMWATRSAPPSHFMLATGLPSRCLFQSQEYKLNHLHIKRNEYRFIRYRGMLEAHETL